MITVEPTTDIALASDDVVDVTALVDDTGATVFAVANDPSGAQAIVKQKRKAEVAKLPEDALYATPGTPECLKLDILEARMHTLPEVEVPVVNTFTPHLYLRQVTVPAGTLIITKIHLTEHPYIVSKGTLSVWTESEGVKRISAPYTGITKAGTRRLCYCHTEVVWTTCHATDETDVDKIEAEIILPHPIDVEALNAGQYALLNAALSPVALLTEDTDSKQLTN